MIQKFKETGNLQYLYQNELDKASFQHDMAYGVFKDLSRRATSNKKLRDRGFIIAKNPKYDGFGLASMVYNFFDKNPLCLQMDLLPVEQLKMKLCLIKN